MNIICLAENTTADHRLQAEHGLSLFIDTKGHRLLFDMGQSDLFARNAARLGVALQTVDTAILSHGHYDHGGGLSTFLSLNDHAPVYLSRYAFEPHWNGDKYIGLSPALADHARLRFTDGVHKLAEGITLYATATDIGTQAHGDGGLTTERDGKRIPEDYRHEQYLLLEENGKRVLISGCSHRGIIELTEYFRPDIVIGGFHVSKLSPEEAVNEYAAALNSCPTQYYTCHCTGVEQFKALSRVMPHLRYLAGGQTLIL